MYSEEKPLNESMKRKGGKAQFTLLRLDRTGFTERSCGDSVPTAKPTQTNENR